MENRTKCTANRNDTMSERCSMPGRLSTCSVCISTHVRVSTRFNAEILFETYQHDKHVEIDIQSLRSQDQHPHTYVNARQC